MTPSAIKDLPRERLLESGARHLSDAELLALQIGSGTASQAAIEVGRRLLRRFGSLRRVSGADPREWMQVRGIGPAIAGRLGAAFEIGRRVAVEPLAERPVIRGPEDIARLKAPRLRDLTQEEFSVVLLNMASRVIGEYLVSRGGLAASIVEPRSVFRQAILQSAASVICVHNHPSGNPEPSAEDVAVTRQLVDAGAIVGIPVRDHVIVAGDTFTSFARRGLV
ncbi:MAG: DNA repair protein RadC [Rhodothermales bacterium]|nr:DNA repair protein RadC [Rhodothermales bacterium]MBO6780602.1 DNA repair protein RadC [Rhodothermales bacterium]